MRSNLFRHSCLSIGCFLLLASAASAQCSKSTIGYSEVGVVSGNPFRAQIVHTTTAKSPNIQNALVQPRTESVARDTQGRILRDIVTGEFERDTGPEAGSTVEEHAITICDPTAETLTEIDTMNATAKIIHARSAAAAKHSAAPASRSFCSRQSAFHENLQSTQMSFQDLGTQTIEGIEAHGVRTTRTPLAATDGGNRMPGEEIADTWCSDELSAVVLRVTETRSGMKVTAAMHNIVRGELDPALFEIPSGYAVTESIAAPRESVIVPRVQP
jgi:hypothetical protein